jgi:hypothetical protein
MDLASIARTRIAFLHTDLDLAETFVSLAGTQGKAEDYERSNMLLAKARLAIESVRRLMTSPPKMPLDDVARLTWRCGRVESSIKSLQSARRQSLR